MDKFVTVTKPVRGPPKDDKKRAAFTRTSASKPQDSKNFETWKDRKRTERLLTPLKKDGTKPSSSALTKHLLNTLSDESNPITHSDIGQRSDHVYSTATGHQRSEGRGSRKVSTEDRGIKLKEQREEKKMSCPKPLDKVRLYINGFLSNTTDIEMKRIVILAGGQVMRSAAGATHILTSQQLNGSKTHKILTSKLKNSVHVVKPEWVTDSIAEGKRRPEREYLVIQDTTTKNLHMFASGMRVKESAA